MQSTEKASETARGKRVPATESTRVISVKMIEEQQSM
ncbi:hypothetical protein HNP81_001796 [Peribacillus huizhouensis]|uniref:Uncharacterized protein n=1 Tax=Peribacillus huizhouensis TaxID=1501239 RepID=A0ABR6CP96_9BACI|nr:hypothetical protein [Peribacillus huizhouensis]